jgi:uncharacterized membrane protein
MNAIHPQQKEEEMTGPVELVIAAFQDEEQATTTLNELRTMEREGVIEVLNAAVLKKRGDGKVSIRETEDVDTLRGTIFGALTGGLIGLIGGPAGAIAGAAAGAATGGFAARKIDMGFPNDTLEELQETLQPGTSAILALIEHEWVDQVIDELENIGAQLFRQSLKDEIAAQLKSDQKGA